MNTPYSDRGTGADGSTGDGRFQSRTTYSEDLGADMSPGASGSVGSLLKELVHEVPSLLRNELALARSEMRENMAGMQKAMGEIATGGAVAMAGLVVVLMAVVYALSEVMEPWLAALLVGGAALVVGYMMVSSGRRKLKNESLRPERTLESLRKDTHAIRGGMQ